MDELTTSALVDLLDDAEELDELFFVGHSLAIWPFPLYVAQTPFFWLPQTPWQSCELLNIIATAIIQKTQMAQLQNSEM